jgi:excinuclease ABC subunit C
MAQARDHRADLCIGPILGLSELRDAVEQLSHAFQLRDCSDRTRFNMSNQLPLFAEAEWAKCIRFELNSCLAPCSGHCSPSRYRQAVDAAKSFLQGDDVSVLEQLQREIVAAVDRRSFERAGVLHKRQMSLAWLARRLAAHRRMSAELTGSFPIPSFDRQPFRLVLEQGYFAGFARGESKRRKPILDSALQHQDDALAVEWMLIIASWFRKNGHQRAFLQRTPAGPARRRVSA